jgi:hypothetical chaperone protein
MKIGIDFGTSYSAAAVMANDRLQKIQFPAGDQFRTAVYFPEAIPDMDDFAFTPELEKRADDMFRRAKSDGNRDFQRATARWHEAMAERDERKRARALELLSEPKPPDDNAIRRSVQRAVRQQWMEEQTQIARAAVADSTRAVFGDAAIDEYMHEGTGHIIQSPKSMLGFDLAPRARATVLNIVGFILEHIRRTATEQLGTAVRHAVIGRPVKFRSSLGDVGTDQAMDLIRQAASKAGYDEITFLEEPVAASFGFHRKRPERVKALIVDVGGGTTDFAFVELGGSRAPKVIGSWGLAMGGTDVDLALAQESFMPLFGRDLPNGAPAHHYVDALSIHDQDKQRKFSKYDYRSLPTPFGPRLRALQKTGNTHRTARNVERTKIHLSENTSARIKLNYIERGLVAKADQASLHGASARFRRNLEKTLDEIAADIATSPDVVFLTGGMSRSPYVVAMIRKKFPESSRVQGDASFGVVRGLAIHAAT